MSDQTLLEKILCGDTLQTSSLEKIASLFDVFLSQGHTLVVPKKSTAKRIIQNWRRKNFTELMEGVKLLQGKLSKYFGTQDFTVMAYDGLCGSRTPCPLPHNSGEQVVLCDLPFQ